MDINIALTRAGIFVFVYLFVLGVPLWLGYKYGLWQYATWLMLVLATTGPFIYQYLHKRTEDIIFKEQKQSRQALLEASKKIARMLEIDELLKTVVITVVQEMRIVCGLLYLKDEGSKSYNRKYCHPQEDMPKCPEKILFDSALVKGLNSRKMPVTFDEINHKNEFFLSEGIVIPFFIGDELAGFMCLGAKPERRPYTAEDILVFETLSYSTSLAIENCNFFKELEDRQRKARLQEMDTYSYSLAHEIDNPMHIVMGQAGLIKEEFLREIPDETKQKEIRESLDFILESARRVSGMVRAIRDFGSPIGSQAKAIKVEDFIESFSQLYFPQFKANAVVFEKEITSDLGYVRGQKPELMQILVILANNALHAMKHAKEKKAILKALRIEPDMVRISFADTGYGIKKDLLPVIFAPFTTTKASSEGTGMGLYNAKRMVEKYKGRIWVESDGEGKGAAFLVELPVIRDVSPQELKEQGQGKTMF